MPKTINPNIALLCGTVLLLGVLAGMFILAWHGTLTGDQIVGVVTAIIAIAAVCFGAPAAASAAANRLARRDS